MRTKRENLPSRYARVISSPAYFPLWLGQLVSNLGDTLNYVAMVVLVYQLSGSALAVSATGVFEIVPLLLLAPVAGVVIDRFPRKAILVASDLARAAVVLALVFADSTWQVYALAFLLTAASVFFNPTVQAVIPNLVEKEALLAANSVAWTTRRLVQIIASAVAGGLIATIGTGPAFAMNSLSFVFSALMLLRLPVPAHLGEIDRASKRGFGGWLGDVREGLGYVRHDTFVSRLLIVQAVASLAVGATGALLVVLSEEHLRLPPEGFAWLCWQSAQVRSWSRSCWAVSPRSTVTSAICSSLSRPGCRRRAHCGSYTSSPGAGHPVRVRPEHLHRHGGIQFAHAEPGT